jgi:hypothetical protein
MTCLRGVALTALRSLSPSLPPIDSAKRKHPRRSPEPFERQTFARFAPAVPLPVVKERQND